MTKIFDASNDCSFKGRKILFDTNVWIAIDGNDPRDHYVHYSNYFWSVLKSNNTLITNDYILSEYFNRSHKIQYDIAYNDIDAKRHYKRRRKSQEFQEYMKVVRDSCLDILRDCTFENAVTVNCSVSTFLSEASQGYLDFSDIVIREHCARSGYVLVSDDGDFATCGLELVTANPRVLQNAKKNHTLMS